MANTNYEAFVEAYNLFEYRPLAGDDLDKYYVDDFTKDITHSIINTVKRTERFGKILVIGHRGCGKSTILNKVADDLQDKYHVVSFSVAEELNMNDIEIIDILMTIYIKLIDSIEKKGIASLLSSFEKLVGSIKDLHVKEAEAGISLLKTVSFKIKVEEESRAVIRKAFKTQIESLRNNISMACENISKDTQKDIVVIIDDLDKLDKEFAEKIFFDETHLVTMPEVKIIYTFPLSSYYSPSYIHITDKFTGKFIRLVNLYGINGQYQEISLEILRKLVLKRISQNLISEDALKYLVDNSGGLLRDLIKFMRDACALAIDDELSLINQDVSKKVVRNKINEYNRLFDFPTYKSDVEKIMHNHNKKEIHNDHFMHLLRFLFILEYITRDEESWYDVHPCLRACLNES